MNDVLLLGTDVGLTSVLAVALEAHCRVQSLPTPGQALSELDALAADLVVVDLLRADSQGASVVRALRARLPGARLVLIITLEEAAWVTELRGVKIDTVLPRPVSLGVLLDLVARLLPVAEPWPALSHRLGGHVARAFEYIAARYMHVITVDRVARALGVSSSHCAHFFPALTDMTVRECVTRVRVEVAKYLLTHTDGTLEALAERSGFCDASHLSRVFLRRVGQSPGAYRRVRRRPLLRHA